MSSSQGQSGRGRRYHVKTRRAFPTRTLSDVILPHFPVCGRAVRKYVEAIAMADSQEFTLLSEVLYDVSSHRQRLFCSRNHPTPASTRRPETLAIDRRESRPSSATDVRRCRTHRNFRRRSGSVQVQVQATSRACISLRRPRAVPPPCLRLRCPRLSPCRHILCWAPSRSCFPPRLNTPTLAPTRLDASLLIPRRIRTMSSPALRNTIAHP